MNKKNGKFKIIVVIIAAIGVLSIILVDLMQSFGSF